MGDIVRRGTAWYVRYKDVDGVRRMRASHQPSKELARRFLLEIEARIARGQVGIAEPAPLAPTIAELVERFLTEYSRPKIKDLASYRMHVRTALRRALPLIGKLAADQLQSADVAKLRDRLGAKAAAGSVHATLAYLSRMYSWAIKQGIVTTNPVRGVERPTAVPSVDYFSREEVLDLLRVAAERAADQSARLLACCVHLAVHTGLRKGELLGLRWQDVDFNSLRLTVARSFQTTPKSGKARHLRLPAACVPILREWRKECPVTAEGRIFPVFKKTLDRWTEELLQAAFIRVPAHPWHALRHTFASHFVMSGGNILTLQKILGHSDVKVTMVYAHLAPDFLGAEMNRIQFTP